LELRKEAALLPDSAPIHEGPHSARGLRKTANIIFAE